MWEIRLNTNGNYLAVNSETKESIELDDKMSLLVEDEIDTLNECDELTPNDIKKALSDFIQCNLEYMSPKIDA